MVNEMKKIKALTAMLIALMMAFCLTVHASDASTVIDWERTGSITITLHDTTEEHNVIPGATFVLYHVADAVSVDNNLAFEYTEAFEGCGADLNDLNAAGLAEELLAYARANGIEGVVKTADENGTVVFEDLPLGLYLIAQEGELEGYYPINPFVVAIPMTNAEGTAWIYDIEASPKAETAPIVTPEPVYRSITVRKVWDDEDDAQHFRPAAITVHLLMDGEVISTVTLSEENGWTYTWEGLEDGHSYTVEEEVPQNYIASYSYGETEIVITNTAKLIQTGQLNWPVPVLAGAGLLALIIGLILISKKKRNA